MKWKLSLSGDSKLKGSVKLLPKNHKNSAMDLTQHFELDYDQILRKCTNMAKKLLLRDWTVWET